MELEFERSMMYGRVHIDNATIENWKAQVLSDFKSNPECDHYSIASGDSMVIGRKVHYSHEPEPQIKLIIIRNGYTEETYKIQPDK
jgi:hypothetical protein